MNKTGFVYIMTNKNRTTLYIGVTNDLCRRIYEHKNHLIKNSFTDKYNLEYCIYYEEFVYFDLAIKREKEIKKWNRQKKEDLINKKNPEWKVLVTDRGFVRESIPFFQQASTLLNEMGIVIQNEAKQSDEIQQIPPFSRNDCSLEVDEGGSIGGEAANASSPSLTKPDCHFERSEKTQTKNETKNEQNRRTYCATLPQWSGV